MRSSRFIETHRSMTSWGAARARLGCMLALSVLMSGASLAQPSPRGYVDMEYVPQVEKVLLFGGQKDYAPPYAPLGETWWYDPASDEWTQVTSEPQPSPRSAAHLAVHAPTGTVVMFGGGVPVDDGFASVSETWLFDPLEEAWTSLSFDEDESPQAVIGEMFAYHEATDLFVLHGGFTLDGFRFVNDTWHFDLAERSWTQVDPDNVPEGRNYNAFAYDPRNEVLVMSGGQDAQEDEVWTYDPRESAWQQREKPPASRSIGYARMVYDEHLDTLIRFGGAGDYSGSAWTVSEEFAWSELAVEGESPGPVSRHAMEFVPGVGVLVFGGVFRGQPDFNDALWVLDTMELRWHER